MHQWHLFRPHLFCVVGKHIEELYGVNWQIHINVVWLSEFLLVGVFFFVDLAHCFSCAHIPALDTIFDLVKLAVVDKVLVAVWIEVVCYYEKSLSCCSDCKRADSAEDISQQLSASHVAEDSISFLLQSRTPVHLLEIELKLYSLFFQFHEVVLYSSHMLKCRRPIDIMQFLCLIDYSFDVWTLQECNFSDDLLVWNLLLCKIVMSHMPDCFKAIRERNVALFSLMLVCEPFEYFLVFNIFEVQLDLCRFNRHFRPLLLRKILNGKVTADEDKLFLRVACDDPLVT